MKQAMNSYKTRHSSFCSLIWYFCNATDARQGTIQETKIYLYKDFNGITAILREKIMAWCSYSSLSCYFLLDHVKTVSIRLRRELVSLIM